MKLLACSLVAVAALSACDSGGDERPRAATGAPKQVGEAVLALDRASRGRKWAEVCDELFTRAARARAGGDDCPALLRSATEDVRRPRIRLVSIEVSGDEARAQVRTGAAGDRPVSETIAFARERGRWRIESLSP